MGWTQDLLLRASLESSLELGAPLLIDDQPPSSQPKLKERKRHTFGTGKLRCLRSVISLPGATGGEAPQEGGYVLGAKKDVRKKRSSRNSCR
jgi:hypothetical protein